MSGCGLLARSCRHTLGGVRPMTPYWPTTQCGMFSAVLKASSYNLYKKLATSIAFQRSTSFSVLYIIFRKAGSWHINA